MTPVRYPFSVEMALTWIGWSTSRLQWSLMLEVLSPGTIRWHFKWEQDVNLFGFCWMTTVLQSPFRSLDMKTSLGRTTSSSSPDLLHCMNPRSGLLLWLLPKQHWPRLLIPPLQISWNLLRPDLCTMICLRPFEEASPPFGWCALTCCGSTIPWETSWLGTLPDADWTCGSNIHGLKALRMKPWIVSFKFCRIPMDRHFALQFENMQWWHLIRRGSAQTSDWIHWHFHLLTGSLQDTLKATPMTGEFLWLAFGLFLQEDALWWWLLWPFHSFGSTLQLLQKVLSRGHFTKGDLTGQTQTFLKRSVQQKKTLLGPRVRELVVTSCNPLLGPGLES